MEDTERLLWTLHNLIESEDRRIAQREEEWKKEKERAKGVKKNCTDAITVVLLR